MTKKAASLTLVCALGFAAGHALAGSTYRPPEAYDQNTTNWASPRWTALPATGCLQLVTQDGNQQDNPGSGAEYSGELNATERPTWAQTHAITQKFQHARAQGAQLYGYSWLTDISNSGGFPSDQTISAGSNQLKASLSVKQQYWNICTARMQVDWNPSLECSAFIQNPAGGPTSKAEVTWQQKIIVNDIGATQTYVFSGTHTSSSQPQPAPYQLTLPVTHGPQNTLTGSVEVQINSVTLTTRGDGSHVAIPDNDPFTTNITEHRASAAANLYNSTASLALVGVCVDKYPNDGYVCPTGIGLAKHAFP